MEDFSYVLENYNIVNENLLRTVEKCNRNKEDVKLIAISKNHAVEKIKVLADNGVKDFGESRVQEFLPKYETLKDYDINWHFIGHLQKNKVKYIVDKVSYIHSVDSYELAKKISEECKKKDVTVSIFLQVNIGNDDNKFGFNNNDIVKYYESVMKLDNIKVVGLMTILPFSEDVNFVGKLYSEMNKIVLDISWILLDNNNKLALSMGMSNDYEIAIENNTNYIRVGTAIFGKRNQGGHN